MRWLSTVFMAWLAGAALGAREAKAAETGAEARLRDALRSATSQLRALENERARWQATEAEQRQELEALRRQLAEAQKRPVPRAPNRCAAELKECQSDQTMLAAAAAKLRDDVSQCEASAARGEAAARARDEERARSAGKEIAELVEQRKACEAKNARMFWVAKEILDRLWKGGAGEPLLGLKRVEVENYAQDAEDRLLEAKVKP
jgi:chromosome segregation ATPase